MGELLAIDPDLNWPLLTVFTIRDQKNVMRGNHWYRDVAGHLQGPFHTKLSASLDLLRRNPTSGTPLRTPFEQDGVWWWKKDTPQGIAVEGPFEFECEADFAIRRHVQDMKDLAGHDQYR